MAVGTFGVRFGLESGLVWSLVLFGGAKLQQFA